MNRDVATSLLVSWGHAVTPATSGAAALAALADHSFDLVLMDVQMPIMDGLQTTAEIRRREEGSGSRTPIVALTAHGTPADRERIRSGPERAYRRPGIELLLQEERAPVLDSALHEEGKPASEPEQDGGTAEADSPCRRPSLSWSLSRRARVGERGGGQHDGDAGKAGEPPSSGLARQTDSIRGPVRAGAPAPHSRNRGDAC